MIDKNTRLWEFVSDMNFDGAVTISDVGLWMQWLIYYPGDWFIQYFMNTDVGRFLEISEANYGELLSLVIST